MYEKIENLHILKNHRVLIVDDDPKQLELISVVLSNFFNTIFSASNGEEALTIFKNKKIDVVFSDYVMPKMDGLKLCKEIRAYSKDTFFVILSNYSDREKLLELIPLNLSAYLLKPLSLKDVVQTLLGVVKEMSLGEQIKINHRVRYSYGQKCLYLEGVLTTLTKNEVLLLELFLHHSNTMVSNAVIENALQEEKTLSYSAIANIIYRLRKKIGKETLVNVQSLGYTLRVL